MRITWKYLARLALFLIVGFAVYMMIWASVQNPTVVWRVFVHGDSDIFDHLHSDFRAIYPAPELAPFQPTQLHTSSILDRGTEEFVQATESLAFVVLKGRQIMHERYFGNHRADTLSLSFSVSKSVTSALIGIAVRDGLIISVDDPITRYLPELSERGFDEVRIGDLLRMAGGLDYVEDDNPFGAHVRLNYTDDLEKEILSFSLAATPQSRFQYKSGENALLGLALARAIAPQTVSDFVQSRLWDPLGMEHNALWTLDRREGLERTWCCLTSTARDLARFGALYRDGGMGPFGRILSATWVQDSLTPKYADTEFWNESDYSDHYEGYGYQWWLADLERGDAVAIGTRGQFVYVDPANDVVIVRLGRSFGRTSDGEYATASDWIGLFQRIAASIDKVMNE